MSAVFAVFGATGQQGNSVINYVLNDPELSKQFRIRAITRDVSSEKTKQLKDKVDVVQGDISDQASIEVALKGAHTVFAMTVPDWNNLEVEYHNAKTIADAAVKNGSEYIIFSTLPAVKEISGGKYAKVYPFDIKAKAEQYIRGLPIKSAFFNPGYFMENLHVEGSAIPFGPQKAPDGTWVFTRNVSPKTLWAWISVVEDTGKFIGAILAEPDKFQGKTFCAAAALYTVEEAVAIMSKSAGKPIVYKQVSSEEFAKSFPVLGDMFSEMTSYSDEFGHYGADTENLVAWAVENARGKLTTLEEYLEAHPLKLV